MRWRLGAVRSEYSSEVFFAGGAGGTDEIFAGETTQLELGATQNVFQSGGLFVDVGAGLRWLDVDLTNLTVYDAKANFLIPGITLQLEDLRSGGIRYASLTLEHGSSSGLSASDDFGREDIDDSWLALRWNAGLRFEPGAGRRGARGFVGRMHEIELSTEGQYAFDSRLVPQEQGVIGGLYTVRGYPQSLVAGDSIYIGRAEYRYHIPLTLSQGSALWNDWNLVLRSFFDLGHSVTEGGTASNGVSLPDEGGDWLASVGLGAELLIRRNFSLRLDYGFALHELEDEGVESGDTEAHLSAIVRY
jgi:hemolysin activation/secretion protein